MSLVRKLREQNGFSDTEKVIADYLMAHFRELTNLSTRQLASRTYTSSAAIVRFSQKLGFRGYSEFKVKFLAEMMQNIGTQRDRFISTKDTVPDIIDKVLRLGVEALQDTHALLKQDDVNRAAHIFRKAAHVDIYAMGDNQTLANMAAKNFIMAGLHVSEHTSISLQMLQCYSTPLDHAALLFSRTGENHNLRNLADRLKIRGIPMVLITAAPKSSMARMSDVAFTTAASDSMEELGPRIYLMGGVYLLHVLYGVLLTRGSYEEARHREEWLEHHLEY